jgi:hypothetical protein
MTTLIIDDKKINFSSINELKIYVYENFWYPEIKEDVEDSWYENWKVDLEKNSFSNIDELLADLKK